MRRELVGDRRESLSILSAPIKAAGISARAPGCVIALKWQRHGRNCWQRRAGAPAPPVFQPPSGMARINKMLTFDRKHRQMPKGWR
jgi:hypothetical protein